MSGPFEAVSGHMTTTSNSQAEKHNTLKFCPAADSMHGQFYIAVDEAKSSHTVVFKVFKHLPRIFSLIKNKN